MDADERNLKKLAESFERQWLASDIPGFSAGEFLDLMDYFTREGMDFEAELCRHFAEIRGPEDPEVLLTLAHCCADDGDWKAASVLRARCEADGYDELLFKVERLVRMGAVTKAENLVLQSLPPTFELLEFDFLYDAAVLFRDYGYLPSAVKLLETLPPSYVDYSQAQELRAECFALEGDYDKANNILNSLLDNAPFDQQLWVKHASYCYRGKKYDEALDACEYALAIGADADAARIRSCIRLLHENGRNCEKMAAEAIQAQDYTFLLEYADRMYALTDYEHALEAYEYSGLFCPRGSRDRERILSNLSKTLIQLGRFEPALFHLKALSAYGDVYFSTFLEVAEILFNKGEYAKAVRVLGFVIADEYETRDRNVLIALLLHHHGCYKEAKQIWKHIIEASESMPASYQPIIEQVKRIIEGGH